MYTIGLQAWYKRRKYTMGCCHPRYEGPVEDEENRYIVLGFDCAGNLLEIMYNRLNEKKVKVFHAMKCRSIFFGLLDE